MRRTKGESIMIGGDIEISFADVRGGTIGLGIAAPRGIPVHRKEVYEAINKKRGAKK